MAWRIRGRIHRHRHGDDAPEHATQDEYVEIDAAQLSGVFAVPGWLRDLGLMSWLLVGVLALLAALIWLLSLTQTITVPVIVAGIIAAVLSPLISFFQRHHIRRGAGAALVFLIIIAVAVLLVYIVITGIGSQSEHIQQNLQKAVHRLQDALKDAGASKSSSQHAADKASSSVSSGFHALLNGVKGGIDALASLAVFLSFTALSLFLLLLDGPRIRAWGERHLGLPPDVSHTIFERTLQSMRGYFAGVTAVAGFNGLVIGLGALIVGVPLAGTIAIVNFVAAYIPYLGAWTAGAFTVLIALGAKGTTAAIIMAVIALLANGALQQMIQPIAYGATLGIHPLAVLIVTIAGGSLFGGIGLVLAAPLTAAAVKIASDIGRSRAEAEARAAAASEVAASGEPPAAPA
jgi:predicted PurR-regulated permease PerM